MNYTAADIKKLREETGAPFVECKKALAEATTWNEALNMLKTWSDKQAEKTRAAKRETREGGIFSYIHHNHRVGVLLELNCSTDFVARSESFRHLASELALQITGAAPRYINEEDVPAEIIKEVIGKVLGDPSTAHIPEEQREEIINSRVKKALGAYVLMLQPWIRDESLLVGDLVRKVIAETGENIVLRRFTRFELGE